MIVTNKNNPTSGNNALAPEYLPSTGADKKRYEDLERSKKDHIKILKEKRTKNKAKVLRNIAVGFIVAITLVYRYCYIYNIEQDITVAKNNISKVKAENENLRIGLLKYNNIETIEKISGEKLNMIPKSRTNVLYTDLEKNNFEDTVKTNTEKKGKSIIERIKNNLF